MYQENYVLHTTLPSRSNLSSDKSSVLESESRTIQKHLIHIQISLYFMRLWLKENMITLCSIEDYGQPTNT